MQVQVSSATKRNRDLRTAQRAKQDEFYTSLRDIELEMAHYGPHFQDKIVYCNCDDPRASNFVRYFVENFESLGLRKLIATCYRSQDGNSFSRSDSDGGVFLEYTGPKSKGSVPDFEAIGIQKLSGDGDFRSVESIELLHQSDIVVTNPPFSLFREFLGQLFEHQKQFLIIGNMNAVTYNEVFPLFQNGQMWYGPSIRSGDREFRVPDDYPLNAARTRIDAQGAKYVRVKGVRWFTNLDYQGRHRDLELTQAYRPDAYPKYANFDAIDVSRTADIPKDYGDPMGVPITLLDKYNPSQFEILGSSRTLARPMSIIAPKGTYQPGGPRFYLPNSDGTFRRMYDRIVVRNRRPEYGFEHTT